MTSKFFLGLAAGLSLAAVACGDSGGEGGGGTGGDATTTGTTTSTTGVTVATSTGTGTTGDGNDSIATAEDMQTDAESGIQFAQGDLDDDPSTDVDFYRFEIAAAGAFWVQSDAKPDEDPFADGYPDLVVELYNEGGDLIAQNDDPFPRDTQDADFFTKLPAGTYYLAVKEFCSTTNCLGDDPDYFSNLSTTAYGVGIAPLDPAEDGILEEAGEPNVLAADAEPWELIETELNSGLYYYSWGFGEFADGSDVDGFTFTIPAEGDLTLDEGRLNINLAIPPSGLTGSGSSRNAGLVEIVRVNDDAVIGSFDMSNETDDVTERTETFAPVEPGVQYLVRIADGGASTGGELAPFYFIIGGISEGNPLEGDDTLNSVVATAEVLTGSANTAGGTGYFVDGNMSSEADVDYYQVAATAGQEFYVSCVGQRGGSGVRGLKATVLDASNTPIASATATESATEDLFIEAVDPGNNANLKVMIESTSQDANVVGNYYRCGFNFIPAQ